MAVVYLLLVLAVALLALWWYRRLSVRDISNTYRIISGLISAGSLVALVFTKMPLWLIPTLLCAIPLLAMGGFFKKKPFTGHGGFFKEKTTLNVSVKDAYDILGLEQTATQDDVIQAHRTLAKKVHPDIGGNDFLVRQINEAKDVLLTHLTQQSQSHDSDSQNGNNQ